jgi:putative hydrolase of the HAD superfamily
MNVKNPVQAVLFDLDETLYPRSAGLMKAIGSRIQLYMEERLGFSREEVVKLRKEYFVKYGTSLRGLQVHNQVDSEDYLAYVHDLPLSEYLAPNLPLMAMLEALPIRKVIFTNATAEHAQSVLRVLGVERFFERIIDVRTFDYLCKPQLEAYQKAAELLKVPPPGCMLVEDNVRNLRPAKQIGMWTVMVGEHEPENGVVDFHVPDVLDVGPIIKELSGG